MNAFASALRTTPNLTRTENGAVTYDSSTDYCVDLFSQIGSGTRHGYDPVQAFNFAFAQDPEVAVRIALWARDIRGGAGRRDTFRKILQAIETNSPQLVDKLIPFIPELGRYDDLFAFQTPFGRQRAFQFILGKFYSEDADRPLLMKWLPREKSAKSKDATAIRKHLNLSPKAYRKILAAGTKVVEQQMCAKEFDKIVYDHVPSVAAARYRKAFTKRDGERFKAWASKTVEQVLKGEKTVNASAVYPHDIIRSMFSGTSSYSPRLTTDVSIIDAVDAQWASLPNYMGDASAIAVVDSSGSMYSPVSGNVRAIDISLALGLYCSMKSKGPFQGIVYTFSDSAKIMKLPSKDRVSRNIMAAHDGECGGTNFQAIFDSILDIAVKNKVSQDDLPKFILAVSDMEFNSCQRGTTNYENARQKFAAAGYTPPKIVFWNVSAKTGNQPAKATDKDVALVSGYSPSIMKTVLSGKIDDFTPRGVMLKTVMVDKYYFGGV